MQERIKNFITPKEELIYFTEKIVMAILENANFNFTSLIEEILIEAAV